MQRRNFAAILGNVEVIFGEHDEMQEDPLQTQEQLIIVNQPQPPIGQDDDAMQEDFHQNVPVVEIC
jgi:hypothetical protein